MPLTRRELLTSAAAFAVMPSVIAEPAQPSFSFVHYTDVHIEPELHAGSGSAMCFDKINTLKPDFSLCGGDLVFDSNATTRQRGLDVWKLYADTARRLAMPVHTIPGNHDVFGLSTSSGIPATDPLYGKKMFEDRIGPRYSAFEHKGWHFLLLDSIGIKDHDYYGFLDVEQLAWLRSQLAAIGTRAPIVVMTHIPIVTGALQIVPDAITLAPYYLVTNSPAFLALIEPYNVKVVLQGHTHIREEVVYKGVRYITSGAVCGNWWKGLRLGHPEGFAVLTVTGDTIAWRYETYGFHADPLPGRTSV
jgi:Icc protein